MRAGLIVIGGGPGGYVAAIRARQLGMSVTLIERDELGGTCLNRGCIPTKAYYQQAEILRTLRELESFGISGAEGKLDMAASLARKDGIVNRITGGVASLLKGYDIPVVRGSARIVAPGRVAVGEEVLEAERILIATGSVNRPLPIPGAELPCVLDSTGLLELDHIPPRLAIIGGGVIGIEFAGIFSSFGSQVSVIEAANAIISGQDGEISKRLTAYLKRQKIDVLTDAKVEGIAAAAAGAGAVLSVTDRKGTQEIAADIVLLAAGRMPCTEGLGLEAVHIAMDGPFIKVDDKYETSQPGIFAVGDVIPGPMLAHLASEEGK
ncbi:MAG: FAD-dependent oxidoreductase, partial [Syntrophomonadaceae bacterium]|nr:FAD-dependent oxidoreductase [Syntrophomonadaceae bacterium]